VLSAWPATGRSARTGETLSRVFTLLLPELLPVLLCADLQSRKHITYLIQPRHTQTVA
jgi:hypothetical protein